MIPCGTAGVCCLMLPHILLCAYLGILIDREAQIIVISVLVFGVLLYYFSRWRTSDKVTERVVRQRRRTLSRTRARSMSHGGSGLRASLLDHMSDPLLTTEDTGHGGHSDAAVRRRTGSERGLDSPDDSSDHKHVNLGSITGAADIAKEFEKMTREDLEDDVPARIGVSTGLLAEEIASAIGTPVLRYRVPSQTSSLDSLDDDILGLGPSAHATLGAHGTSPRDQADLGSGPDWNHLDSQGGTQSYRMNNNTRGNIDINHNGTSFLSQVRAEDINTTQANNVDLSDESSALKRAILTAKSSSPNYTHHDLPQ